MFDYSGDIVRDAAVRGPNPVINALHSLMTDTADPTHESGITITCDRIQFRYLPEWPCANALDRAN